MKISEMRAYQQTVQAYTHVTTSPIRSSNNQQKQKSPNNNHTASTTDTSKKLQGELVPSFLKALYITQEDTIFDDDIEAGLIASTSQVTLGLKSLTNSAEGALSAPEALKLRMAEMNRSKSALAAPSTAKTAISADEPNTGHHLAHQNYVDQHLSGYGAEPNTG